MEMPDDLFKKMIAGYEQDLVENDHAPLSKLDRLTIRCFFDFIESKGYIRAPQWQDISTAPRDGTPILVFAPSRDGLPDLMAVSKYHPDAGFCIDEIRFETHWHPLPAPPEVGS